MANVLPDWVDELRPLAGVVGVLVEFARDPYGFLKSRVLLWVVAAVLTLVEVITGKIRDLWGIIADAVESVGASITFGFGNAGTSLLSALAILPNLLADMASTSGPLGYAAPVVVGLGGALVLFVAWHALKRTPGVLWTLYQAIPGT